jgi:hypothetical protein
MCAKKCPLKFIGGLLFPTFLFQILTDINIEIGPLNHKLGKEIILKEQNKLPGPRQVARVHIWFIGRQGTVSSVFMPFYITHICKVGGLENFRSVSLRDK